MSNKPTTLNNSRKSWSCSHCTYINSPKSTECDMCGSPYLTDSISNYHQMMDSQNNYDIIASSELWPCNYCTYLNSPKLTECDMCGNPCLTDSVHKYHPVIRHQVQYLVLLVLFLENSIYSVQFSSTSMISLLTFPFFRNIK